MTVVESWPSWGAPASSFVIASIARLLAYLELGSPWYCFFAVSERSASCRADPCCADRTVIVCRGRHAWPAARGG